jgi:hypothetical protein
LGESWLADGFEGLGTLGARAEERILLIVTRSCTLGSGSV